MTQQPEPTDPYDDALAAVRVGCCGERRKPCQYHEGWGSGFEACQRLAPEVARYDGGSI